MVSRSRILTRSAAQSDLSRLANLIHFETFTHRHLDYRPPLDWIGREPFLVLEEDGRIEAALACPPDPPEISWLRLFAVSTSTSPITAWESLWKDALLGLVEQKTVRYIAAIPLYNWFESILKKSGFEQTHSIVMLNREISGAKLDNLDSKISIRTMQMDDLDQVVEIDRVSFSPIWANSQNYLEAAFRLAISATVAAVNGSLVGYQISKASALGGHLARLAVRPDLQGQGIGQALLNDLIQQLAQRGSRAITVNTQKDNLASLRLYQRMGFTLTGEEYPIFQLLAF